MNILHSIVQNTAECRIIRFILEHLDHSITEYDYKINYGRQHI